jgi:DNA relaxase NicK
VRKTTEVHQLVDMAKQIEKTFFFKKIEDNYLSVIGFSVVLSLTYKRVHFSGFNPALFFFILKSLLLHMKFLINFSQKKHK